ncbi:uncharacterized protein SAZU_0638 [Streptomyces azureus]|uniref:Uncharacterized protein n=1 Tax=Streptomyces azureus TaxID=146537 RepID=A0A0K8PDU9_STRAJ|nr:uncharacterized protein SAZU_0638 [Streptomyces azureus]
MVEATGSDEGAKGAAMGPGTGIAYGDSRSWSGTPVLALSAGEAGGAVVPSAGVSGSAVCRPTGRITAGRRPSGVSGSFPGVAVGLVRGVNQPPPPPEVPLSADVVVGASMVCLASSIFRSVCALPQWEGACFPPWTDCVPIRVAANAATFNPCSGSVRTSKARV